MASFYDNLRKVGLGQYVPNQYKRHRSIPRSTYRETQSRYAESQVKELERYQQTVWPEYRGHSFIEAYKPSSPMQRKAMHQHAMSVFDSAIAQLQAFERDGCW